MFFCNNLIFTTEIRQKSMRNYNIICLVGLIAFFMSGCNKPNNLCDLSIINETSEDLWIESSIVSSYSDNTILIPLQVGKDHRTRLAQSDWTHSNGLLPLSACVYNKDACVKVFKMDSAGAKTLVHVWHYTDRNEDGHELFSESCLEKHIVEYVDGAVSISYIFTILPEDIVE